VSFLWTGWELVCCWVGGGAGGGVFSGFLAGGDLDFWGEAKAEPATSALRSAPVSGPAAECPLQSRYLFAFPLIRHLQSPGGPNTACMATKMLTGREGFLFPRVRGVGGSPSDDCWRDYLESYLIFSLAYRVSTPVLPLEVS